MLAVDGATFGYPGRPEPVFRAVDLAVAPSSVLCILGPNGVGKSTLLRCLAGLERLSAGSIRLDGRPLETLARAEIGRRVAMVPQSHDVVFAFTARAIVEMGRAPHLGWLAQPSRQNSAIADAALDRLGIGHLGSRPYTELSGGERQLVLVARALAQESRLLILDEPTAHLDFANQAEVLDLVRRLSGDGLAVIMTTHSPDHAFAVADQTLVMAHGQAAAGPTHRILTAERLSRTFGRRVELHEVAGRVTCIPVAATNPTPRPAAGCSRAPARSGPPAAPASGP